MEQIKLRLDNLIYTVDKDDVLEIERLANLGAVEYDEDIQDEVEEVVQDNETEDEPKKEKKASKK